MSSGNRVRRLAKSLEASGIDAAVIVPGPNLRYLLGVEFLALERLIALTVSAKGGSTLIVPELERGRCEELGLNRFTEVISYDDSTDPYRKLTDVLSSYGVRRVGVEGSMQYRIAWRLLSGGFKLMIIDEILHDLRVVKDSNELEAIKQAVRVVEDSIVEGFKNLRPGVSERELSRIVRDRAEELGAEEAPYCIVQSGPNTALPHAMPSSRKLVEGDVVLFDVSIRFNGYFADLTRTFVLGKAKPEHVRIYELVRKAQESAINSVKPGVKASKIDEAARRVISGEGYGPYFIHRTGHGLGVEVHERPYISPLSDEVLREGMVFTVEPGVYLPGRFGVRLEDDVVVTRNGFQDLTKLRKTIEGP